MIAFILGLIVGSAVTVLVPAVFNWTKKQTDSVKNKL